MNAGALSTFVRAPLVVVSLALSACSQSPSPTPPPPSESAVGESSLSEENVLAYLELDARALYLLEENAEEAARILAAEPIDETHWRIRVPAALLALGDGALALNPGDEGEDGEEKQEDEEIEVEIDWSKESVQIWNERTGKKWDPEDPDPPWDDLVRLTHRGYCATAYEKGTKCRGPHDFEEMNPPRRWTKSIYSVDVGQCQDGGNQTCWEKRHHVSDVQICLDANCAQCDATMYPQHNWMCLEL